MMRLSLWIRLVELVVATMDCTAKVTLCNCIGQKSKLDAP